MRTIYRPTDPGVVHALSPMPTTRHDGERCSESGLSGQVSRPLLVVLSLTLFEIATSSSDNIRSASSELHMGLVPR